MIENGIIYNNNFTVCEGLFDKTLEKIVLNKNVKFIKANAFDGNDILKEVILPEGIKEIGIFAFFNCKNLSKINLPDTITKIDKNAFALTNLKNPILPKSLNILGDNAFKGVCFSFNKYKMPENLVHLSTNFSDKINIDTFILPENLTNIQFTKSCNINRFEISNKNNFYKTVDGNLYTKELKSLIRKGNVSPILKDIKYIRGGAFSNIDVDELILPENLELLENFAFINARIKKLTLAKNCNYLDFEHENLVVDEIDINGCENFYIKKDCMLNKSDNIMHCLNKKDTLIIPKQAKYLDYSKFKSVKAKTIILEESENPLHSDFFNIYKNKDIKTLIINRPTTLHIGSLVNCSNIETIIINIPNVHINGILNLAQDVTVKCHKRLFNDLSLIDNPHLIIEKLDKDKIMDDFIKGGNTFKEINKIYKDTER